MYITYANLRFVVSFFLCVPEASFQNSFNLFLKIWYFSKITLVLVPLEGAIKNTYISCDTRVVTSSNVYEIHTLGIAGEVKARQCSYQQGSLQGEYRPCSSSYLTWFFVTAKYKFSLIFHIHNEFYIYNSFVFHSSLNSNLAEWHFQLSTVRFPIIPSLISAHQDFSSTNYFFYIYLKDLSQYCMLGR